MRLFFILVLTLLLAAPSAGQDAPAKVAAASDLQFALPEIVAQFERATGKKVQLTFGSSGNFMRQIAQGAPFEIFLSADEGYVDKLFEQGLTQGRGVNYAVGRLTLYTQARSRIRPDFADLRAALADGRLRHFAIANPEHAPYGRAAREVLQREELWQPLQQTLVLGENVSQAAQFVLSGSAQAGIVPYALALSPTMGAQGQFVLLDESTHAPLRQRMVLLKSAGPAATAFYAYLQAPEARTVLSRYGFALRSP